MTMLARLALRNVQRVNPATSFSASSLLSSQKTILGNTPVLQGSNINLQQPSRDGNGDQMMMMRKFTTTSSSEVAEKSDQGREVSVTEKENGEGRKKSKSLFSLLSPRKKGSGGSLWRKKNTVATPFDLQYIFPSGLGDALVQASENLNRLFENLTPSGLIGRIKERDDHYKLKYEVPGLAKEDIKITVEDGILTIHGEHKEEQESSDDDDEHWSSFGYYNASIILPDDAKADDIKAEIKDGVLTIIVPRTEKPKKEVKEVPIN
ncbi:hypothetical protein AQUCO_00600009v1 [Aquilegia coerulea]|uniref:SHSP domain-containing protein n=1 Tax=Aquilegia coerulea TaxID=218851 RepID=A0A2G5EMI8_AQUCA|nr:hypothetical protein AQUCO_00600009v1 [Aquilegia coerulea]